MKIILASASPRRRELIKNLGIEYEVKTADCEEETVPGEHPKDTVTRLSRTKALWVEAAKMLRELSGRTHRVYTGMTVTDGNKTVSEYVRTDVKFYELSDKQIESYVNTGEPMDKAGAYGIQEYGSLLVESISGDYFNVVGLPVSRLRRVLNENFGVKTLI